MAGGGVKKRSILLCGLWLREAACTLELSEKIVTQRNGDATEQFGVDAPLAENFVNIGAVAANFLCEPSRRAALTAQFVADQRTDVNLNATFFGSS